MKKIILFMTMTCMFWLNGCDLSTVADPLILPKSEELSNIMIAKQDVELVYTDITWMDEFLTMLNNAKATSIQSVNDQPDVTETYKITFHYDKQAKTDTLYFYEKNGKYYIEQPYQGVYRFSTRPDKLLDISVSNDQAELVRYQDEQYDIHTLSKDAKQWLDLSEEEKMKSLDHPEEIVGGRNMVMINGRIYIDSGEYSSAVTRCGVVDGEITTTVQKNQRPKVNDEANFGIGYEYQYGVEENTIEINMDHRWRVFVAEE